MTSLSGSLFAQEGCTAAELDYIRQGAEELGVLVTEEQISLLARFLRDLSIWNHRFRMVGTRDRKTFLRLHILDCLAPARRLGTCASLIDIGSGAGLPGVPVSIVCPDLTVTLVDNRRVRASFLRDIVRQLHLRNTRVIEANVEQWARERQAASLFGATITRAWRGVPELLRVSAGLVRSGGIAVAMLGPWKNSDSRQISKIAGEQFEDPVVSHYRLPGGPEHRSLAVFRRR